MYVWTRCDHLHTEALAIIITGIQQFNIILVAVVNTNYRTIYLEIPLIISTHTCNHNNNHNHNNCVATYCDVHAAMRSLCLS